MAVRRRRGAASKRAGAKKGRRAAMTRKRGGGGFSLFSRVWSPFGHLLMAGEETSQELGSTAGKIVKETIGAVRKVGSSVASHSNQAVRNLTSRRSSSRRKAATRRNGRKH